MSKITRALEKAARERIKDQQERATVTAESVTVPLVAEAAKGVDPIPSVGGWPATPSRF